MSNKAIIERLFAEEATAIKEAERKKAAAKQAVAEAEEADKQANQKKAATKQFVKEWAEKSHKWIEDEGPSNRLTIRVIQSPRVVCLDGLNPVTVDHFEEPTDFKKFIKALKGMSMKSEDEKDKGASYKEIQEQEGGNVWIFPKGQPRAVVGSSPVWKDHGFFVPEQGDKYVSNGHAAVFVDKNGQFCWLDLESTNGSFLILPDSKEVLLVGGDAGTTDPVQLEDGTIVFVEDTVLMIRLPHKSK